MKNDSSWNKPHARLSLWDIMREAFLLHPLITVIRQFGHMQTAYARQTTPVIPETIANILRALAPAIDILEKLEMHTSKNMLLDFQLAIERGHQFTGSEFGERCFACFKTMQCEAEHVMCERVDGRVLPSLQYEQRVIDRFPSAVAELDEGSWCLTYERWTAAVFHSMRAAEVVLKAAWTTLGLLVPKKADSWGNLLGPMDIELATPLQHSGARPLPPKNAIWQANLTFFSEVVADLRAVKRAYRDTTMHVESVYAERDAKAIHTATLSLVAHTATHLDQDGAWFA